MLLHHFEENWIGVNEEEEVEEEEEGDEEEVAERHRADDQW